MSLTKAQKLARRRARSAQRKDLPRTPSGQLSRSAERYEIETTNREKDARIVVMQARVRTGRAVESTAGLAEAGSSIGRLVIAGQINSRLYEAAKRFDEDVWRYHRLTGIPHPSPKAMDIGRVRGRGHDSDVVSERAAASKYMKAIGVLGQVDVSGRPVRTAVNNCVVMDYPADNWPPHMVAYLVRGLRALADYYQIPTSAGFSVLTDGLKSAHTEASSEMRA
ncbi:MAG: hypothetical protein J0I45_16380 [Bosea sp.]|nr:hypothetical protein [Bosea sp. (in: a-proteobacteria)]